LEVWKIIRIFATETGSPELTVSVVQMFDRTSVTPYQNSQRADGRAGGGDLKSPKQNEQLFTN
jgi:hypothetical protein